jgi:hypothetical protein
MSTVHSPGCKFDPGVFSSPHSTADSVSFHCRSKNRSDNQSAHIRRGRNDDLRFLVLNANSAKGKPAEIANICDYTTPDIIIMSETKLDKSAYTAEFLPTNYVAIRKDRTRHGGGVLIATRKDLVVDEITLKDVKDCELVFPCVELLGGSPLSVGAYYRFQLDNSCNESLDGLRLVTSLVMGKQPLC